MKISPPIDAVAAEVDAWALRDGWKTVGTAIADQYHVSGGGDILPKTDTEKGLSNAIQRVKRIFRGYDGPRYAAMAEGLKAAALVALESPDDPAFRATVAAKDSIEAVNAVHRRASPDVIVRETAQAIAALVAMQNAAVKYFERASCT